MKQFGTPGPRAIYPELCASPSLGRCGILANALFPRLIAQADDQGRLAGSAHSILVACMGQLLHLVSVSAIAEALEELEAAEAVLRYVHRDAPYVQIVGWWRWQQSQRRAYPSRWPAPRGWTDLVYGASRTDAETFEQAAEASPPRNAAIRGTSPRSAATHAGPRAGPHAGPRPRAMPDPAVATAVPSRTTGLAASEGGEPGGMRASAEAILANPASSEAAKEGARAILSLGRRASGE